MPSRTQGRTVTRHSIPSDTRISEVPREDLERWYDDTILPQFARGSNRMRVALDEARALVAAIDGKGILTALRQVERHPPSPMTVVFLLEAAKATIEAAYTAQRRRGANARDVEARAWVQSDFDREVNRPEGCEFKSKAEYAEAIRPVLQREFTADPKAPYRPSLKTITDVWLRGRQVPPRGKT